MALWARERAMSAFSDEKQNNLKYMNDFQTLLSTFCASEVCGLNTCENIEKKNKGMKNTDY